MSGPTASASGSYGVVVLTTDAEGSSWMARAKTATQVIVALFALIIFIFGAVGAAHEMTGGPGYDELFCVVGASVLFLFVMPLYNVIRSVAPPLPPVDTLATIVVVMHILLLLAQYGVLQAYLVRWVGTPTLGFLAIDLLTAPVVGFENRYATAWATLYIALTNVKFYLIWRTAFFDPAFQSADESLGPNGLLAVSLMTLPVIQFFILTSRLRRGMDLFSAYTTNMVAVFAHTLHVMDCTALFMQSSEQELAVVGDSQYLYLVLSIMGAIASNLYHVLLFFPSGDDSAAAGTAGGGATGASAAMQRLTRGGLFDFDNNSGGGGGIGGTMTMLNNRRRTNRHGRGGGAISVASLGASVGTHDEALVHYLMWLVFFVDLPFGALRLISWWVHGVELSSLFAKNVMMCVSATHLLVVHSRDADDQQSQGFVHASEARAR